MPMPEPLPESEGAAVGPAVVGFPGTLTDDPSPRRPPEETTPRICPICGVELRGRQTSACSDKHRAALSRRKRIPVKAEELRHLRALVTTTLESLWEAKAALHRYGGG